MIQPKTNVNLGTSFLFVFVILLFIYGRRKTAENRRVWQLKRFIWKRRLQRVDPGIKPSRFSDSTSYLDEKYNLWKSWNPLFRLGCNSSGWSSRSWNTFSKWQCESSVGGRALTCPPVSAGQYHVLNQVQYLLDRSYLFQQNHGLLFNIVFGCFFVNAQGQYGGTKWFCFVN